MFVKFLNKLFNDISIERLDNDSCEISGNKLFGEFFEYKNGCGEANVYQIESGQIAIELRFSDSNDHIHILIKCKSYEKAKEIVQWMQKDIYKTKS